MTKLFDHAKAPYLLILPSILVITAVAFYPILKAAYLSLFEINLKFNVNNFIGIANYFQLLQDNSFFNALLNTLYFVGVSLFFELILGLLIALVINQPLKGKGLVKAVILIPWAIPTVVSAKMWKWIFNYDYGILNYLLKFLHLISDNWNWLGSKTFAMNSAILAEIWKTTPFMVLLLFAGLQVIPEDLYKSAKVDGAGVWYRFWHITLPLLKPTLLVAVLFRALDAFRVFDVIFVLTGGGPADTTEVLSLYTYKQLFSLSNFGYGSALAVVTFVCVMVFSSLFIKLFGLSLETR
ncbi:MAG: ABC transporter permease [candidate division Zixibacteria bacterium SM1_73]|nr:MAG: ABC transporter permease [candidate division Zixibacteria bacterium SM1_73]